MQSKTVFPRRRRTRSGQALILFAIVFALLAGILGLTLDGGRLYFEKRRAQNAADAGSVAAVQELRRGNDDYDADVRPAALNDAALHGFTEADSVIAVNRPPAGGPSAGNNSFVEVIVERQVATSFMRIFGPQFSTVRARAVSGLRYSANPCVLALDPSASSALRLNGGPTLEANCDVVSNSTSATALNNVGGGSLTGAAIGVSGGYSGGGSYSPTPLTGVLPSLDPLAALDPPTCSSSGTISAASSSSAFGANAGAVFAAQNGNGGNGNGGGGGGLTVYSPGSYSSEIKISNGVHQFQAGIYCLAGGMTITGGTVTGSGVSFYNQNPTGKEFIDIGGDADIDFSAPLSGEMKGVLFFNDRNAPDRSPGNKIARGNGDQRFQGALYFPSQHLDWAGNRLSDVSWSMVIAKTLNISGTSDVQVVNAPTETEGPPVYRALLTE